MTSDLLGTTWVTWAGIVFLLAFSAWIWLGWYLALSGRSAGTTYAAVAAQVLFVGQVLGAMLLLGWLGMLRPLPLILVSSAISACVYLLGVRPVWKSSLDRNRASFATIRRTRIPLWVGLLGFLAVLAVFRNIFWGWFLPPFQRDDIAYHLPIMGNILQSGAIRYFPSPAERISSFPINAELFQGWHAIFLGGDKLVDLAFLPGILIGGLAMYGICRRFGFSRRASTAGWAVFAFTPLVFLQQLGSYNDAWMAALFLCGVYVLLSPPPASGRTGEWWTVALAGICSGIILGTKFSGALLSVGLGSLLILRGIQGPASDGGRKKPLAWRRWSGLVPALSIFVLFTLFFGAYPLVRNAIYAGNPLAPVEVKIGNTVIWPGKSAAEMLAQGSEEILQRADSWGDRFYLIWFEKSRLLFDWNNCGTGPIWLFLGMPGALLWTWTAFRKRSGPAIAIALISLMILFFTPAQWRPRYVLALLLICGLGGALLIDSLRTMQRNILLAGLVLSAAFVTAATLRPAPLGASQAMEFVLRRDDFQRNAARVHGNNEFYEWVEERTRSAPALIVYGRWVDTYPLFGSDLRNAVFSLAAYSPEEWSRQLMANGVDLVVVADGSPEQQYTQASNAYTEVYRRDNLAVWEKK